MEIFSKLFYLWFIIKELHLPILKTTSTELVSGISGDSEYKIRKLFDQAKVKRISRN
jgi:hypothetical protein